MGKDIVNIPIDLEIKSRADFSPLAWLRQSQKRSAISGEMSFVCVRMNGQGESPESYLAFTDMKTLTELLLKAGYGEFQKDSVELEPERCTVCGSWKIVDGECRVCDAIKVLG